jgi:eukaryotic-like serine/threonine-protein kinase
LMLLPLQGDRKPIVLLQTPESDSDARFSPDGRWIAYHSRLNGRSVEVYVQGFSGDGKIGLTGTRLQISNGGAGAPLWRGDGKEVYYQTVSGGKVMAAALQFVPQLQAARPRELFTIDLLEGRLHSLDVTLDGKKFLAVLNPRQKPQPPRLTVVTDWQARLGK